MHEEMLPVVAESKSETVTQKTPVEVAHKLVSATFGNSNDNLQIHIETLNKANDADLSVDDRIKLSEYTVSVIDKQRENETKQLMAVLSIVGVFAYICYCAKRRK